MAQEYAGVKMFMVSEYAACLLFVIMLFTAVIAVCGIAYMLKSAAAFFTQTFREVRTPALVPAVARADVYATAKRPS